MRPRRPQTPLAKVVFERVSRRVFDLTIDQIPDSAYRVAANAHDVLMRANDEARTHVRQLAERARRPRAS